MHIDFLEGLFDLSTLRLLSGSHTNIHDPRRETRVFIEGKKACLFNVYDILEVALRDQLLSITDDKETIDLACELIMDEFAVKTDEINDISEVGGWLTTTNILAVCGGIGSLPWHRIGEVASRLRVCLLRIASTMTSEENPYR